MKNRFKILAKETLYQGFFRMMKYQVQHDLYRGGESKPYSREVMERGHAVAVLLYDPDRDEVVLVEQFRAGAVDSQNPWLIELVAGIVEEGESLEDVAKRESLEECGATVNELKMIVKYFNSAGGSTETTTLFYAEIDSKNVNGIHGLDDENEDIKVIKLKKATFLDKLDRGEFVSGSLVMAGFWFKTYV